MIPKPAMIIAVAAISLVVAALYLLKRQLDKQLEEEEEAAEFE